MEPLWYKKTDLEEVAIEKVTETVFIDPGHGGHDPGAVGFDGLKEADVALDISLRISDKLRLFEIEPVLSRTDDTYISLGRRASEANVIDADLFVCIHCNSFHDRQANGMEDFYLILGNYLI